MFSFPKLSPADLSAYLKLASNLLVQMASWSFKDFGLEKVWPSKEIDH